jgi:hypothetical protein
MSESPKSFFHVDGTPASFEPLAFPKVGSLSGREKDILEATTLDFMNDPNYSSMISFLLAEFPSDKYPGSEQ